jgi:FtsH-binding integral membrane protein
VLTLHTVWSIPTSIGLVEALVPERSTTPWLGGIGLTATGILFVLGAAASTAMEIKQDHFVASTPQFAVSAIVCIVAIIVAFRLPSTTPTRTAAWVPGPWLVGAGALLAGSAFMMIPNGWDGSLS